MRNKFIFNFNNINDKISGNEHELLVHRISLVHDDADQLPKDYDHKPLIVL